MARRDTRLPPFDSIGSCGGLGEPCVQPSGGLTGIVSALWRLLGRARFFVIVIVVSAVGGVYCKRWRAGKECNELSPRTHPLLALVRHFYLLFAILPPIDLRQGARSFRGVPRIPSAFDEPRHVTHELT